MRSVGGILAIPGSLRAASINAAFCRATSCLAPAGLHVTVYSALGQLPPFNSDLEAAPPPQVVELRSQVAASDALLIASPEYAHGMAGSMKNALDWLVSFEGFVGKPVAVVNTSPRAHHAYEALLETLRTMSAIIVDDASVGIPLLGNYVTEDDMLRSADVSSRIRSVLSCLQLFLAQRGKAQVGDVPSPIDLRDVATAREWERTAEARPGRGDMLQAFVAELRDSGRGDLKVLELGSGPGSIQASHTWCATIFAERAE